MKMATHTEEQREIPIFIQLVELASTMSSWLFYVIWAKPMQAVQPPVLVGATPVCGSPSLLESVAVYLEWAKMVKTKSC